MPDQNKAIVRRTFEEILNQGNFAIINERFASDYVGHAITEVEGPDDAKQFAAAMRNAFPDFQYTIEDEIAEGDRVVHRWTARGTHKGEFQGIPPTGEQVKITGISVYRLADGKMVEGWTNADMLGMEKK
jgi:steroid delta-isomerase-like uncharacterized protein